MTCYLLPRAFQDLLFYQRILLLHIERFRFRERFSLAKFTRTRSIGGIMADYRREIPEESALD